MTGKDILTHSGNISHEQAFYKAKEEYSKFEQQTRNNLSAIEKDFLQLMEVTEKKIKKK